MKRKLWIGGVIMLALVIVGAGAVVLVNWQVNAAIEQEWQTTRVEKINSLGATRALEILPLFEEATARADLELEHGVAYLIRTDDANILLDVGMTPARFSHNLQAMGVSEKDFDALFITHLHPDHTGGTDAWLNNMLVAGDPALNLQGKRVYLPLPVKNADLDTVVVNAPLKLANGVASIGAIAFPELFPLSLKTARNAEQALAVNVEGKGIVLITGCGHPTIERIVARAQATFDEPIVGIVGGLHYEGLTREQVQPHIVFVRALEPQLVALSPHDSSPAAIQEFRTVFPNVYQEIELGRAITFPRAQGPIGAATERAEVQNP